ncbi:Ig-like domain-containing protein [Aquimarina algiphila]|uniref:Ig-like domain-containing protein n=1 Tax=Aquimarina algiphila TaxID=2047982 RepID=UPI00249374E0|nr:Ig-like domain-containing protein [Aquimarina algiphila]
MKKLYLFTVLLLLTILNSNAQISGGVRPDGAKPNQLRFLELGAFTDDFENGINNSKWKNDPGLNVGAWTWSTNNTIVENGKLKIKVTREGHTINNFNTINCGQVNRDFYFKSGALATLQRRVYGYYEAKMKGTKMFPGMSPAFWLYSDIGPRNPPVQFDYAANGYNTNNNTNNVLPSGKANIEYCEIDIVEAQQGDFENGELDGVNVTDHNLHAFIKYPGEARRRDLRPKPYPKQQRIRNENTPNFNPGDEFHTYAVENRKDSIIWYLDGIRIGAKPNTTWHLPMRMIFSMGMRRWFVNFNDPCSGRGPAEPFFTNPKEDPNAKPVTEANWPVDDATMEVEYVKSWQVAPSIWLDEANFNEVTTTTHLGKIDVKLNYHGGSEHSVVSDPQFNGVSLNLVLKKRGQTTPINPNVGNKRVSDPSTTSVTKRYAGISRLSIDLSGVKPTSQLDTDEYYVIAPVFKSSNGSFVFEQREIPVTIGVSGNPNRPVAGVNITSAISTVLENETIRLTHEIVPSDATNQNVTWTSFNPNVATVDQNGVVRGISQGRAEITVETEDGNTTATIAIQVTRGSTGGNLDKFFITNRQTGKKIRPYNTGNIVQAPSSASNKIVQWEKIETSNGWFHLRNVQTGKYFSPKDNSNANGSVLQERPITSTGFYTQWKQIPTSNGYFYLQNRGSNKFIRPNSRDDISNSTGNNFKIVQRPTTVTGYFTQWKFENVSSKSITTNLKDLNIKIYPNPVKDYINIEFSQHGDKNPSKVSIYDLSGKMIYSELSSSSKMTIDTRSMYGFFLLKIQNRGQSFVQKLIIE